MKWQHSAYFKFLGFLQIQTYQVTHILEGCAMVLATGDRSWARSYSKCVYIQVTRYVFSQFTTPEA